MCHPLEIIFIHYKSRIATAIRGLLWMEMTIVNSGLKGLIRVAVILEQIWLFFPLISEVIRDCSAESVSYYPEHV